ncbi:hypothetical protein BOTBODRAFT_186924 [Botryobasidium botryosum FD-172 SS1]|uniref:Uncharacterized protein n=1 Tax=Botryobasidium botryosum (strain FD-172 SS1) TaxID=930990 RepID=A0A067MK23_BOTB1|nr:hypothetical protein BOTBODRAFT_186924 [Botryobasidium botryosum FD-172 SS1]
MFHYMIKPWLSGPTPVLETLSLPTNSRFNGVTTSPVINLLQGYNLFQPHNFAILLSDAVDPSRHVGELCVLPPQSSRPNFKNLGQVCHLMMSKRKYSPEFEVQGGTSEHRTSLHIAAINSKLLYTYIGVAHALPITPLKNPFIGSSLDCGSNESRFGSFLTAVDKPSIHTVIFHDCADFLDTFVFRPKIFPSLRTPVLSSCATSEEALVSTLQTRRSRGIPL